MELTWFVLAGLVFFAVAVAREQLALRQRLNLCRIIAILTQLAREGDEIESYSGSGIEGPKREDYFRRALEWSFRVRSALERECPEFLADWDIGNSQDRPLRLAGIITTLQTRIVS